MSLLFEWDKNTNKNKKHHLLKWKRSGDEWRDRFHALIEFKTFWKLKKRKFNRLCIYNEHTINFIASANRRMINLPLDFIIVFRVTFPPLLRENILACRFSCWKTFLFMFNENNERRIFFYLIKWLVRQTKTFSCILMSREDIFCG